VKRWRNLAAAAAVLVAGALSLQARHAHAYTFLEEVSDDPCERMRAFDPQDSSAAAQHARRACRLATFERRLAEERREAVASQQTARSEWVQKWLETAQPARVSHPIAIEAFFGNGIVNYGGALSWTVHTYVEVNARFGRREMTCTDANGGMTADCTRTTWGAGARGFLFDKDFSPFVAVGFSTTNAPLKIVHPNMNGGADYLDGKGNANSVSGGGGVQLATSYVRFSLEYLYEYVFYTGAILNTDSSFSEALNSIWVESLKTDRHGVRFQVGFAF